MVRAFQNIYGQARECLGYSRRTLREGKLPAAFHRLARAIDANRTLAAFALVVLFGLIAGGAMFQTTAAITGGGIGGGPGGSGVTPIAVPSDGKDDRSIGSGPPEATGGASASAAGSSELLATTGSTTPEEGPDDNRAYEGEPAPPGARFP